MWLLREARMVTHSDHAFFFFFCPLSYCARNATSHMLPSLYPVAHLRGLRGKIKACKHWSDVSSLTLFFAVALVIRVGKEWLLSWRNVQVPVCGALTDYNAYHFPVAMHKRVVACAHVYRAPVTLPFHSYHQRRNSYDQTAANYSSKR